MASRVIKTELQRDNLFKFLRTEKLPITVSWIKGHDRTGAQNNLMWQWCKDIERQTNDNDMAGIQAIMKLEIGAPILRAENETFRELYDKVVKPHDYETKIAMMRSGMISVTSRMTKKQMINFLDRVWSQYTGMGIELMNPDPELVGMMAQHKR